MNILLELRHNSNRPVHYSELKDLVVFAAEECIMHIREVDLQNQNNNKNNDENENGNENDDNKNSDESKNELNERLLEDNLPYLTKDLEKLLFRLTNTLKSDNKIWEILSIYHQILSNRDVGQIEVNEQSRKIGKLEVLLQLRSFQSLCDIRLKQLRNLVQATHWERDNKQV